MRNFYLFEQALKVGSVNALEQGLNNLNNIPCKQKSRKEDFSFVILQFGNVILHKGLYMICLEELL